MSKKPELRYITPTLESITVRGKYIIKEKDFSVIQKRVAQALMPFDFGIFPAIGESIILSRGYEESQKGKKNWWFKTIRECRAGYPVYLTITSIEHFNDDTLVEVECRPALWYKISQLNESSFKENAVQEALLECRGFVKQTMSLFRSKEVEPVSVYPIIQRTEIKSRLLNLGLKEIVDKLDKAEEHIVQNDFPESLKSSRTAFEKMIDWQMNKRGLAQTNSYHNNLERIKSKGYLDLETTKLLQTYYECLSVIVHEKGVSPGIFEAQMEYGITLIMLDYFANKLP